MEVTVNESTGLGEREKCAQILAPALIICVRFVKSNSLHLLCANFVPDTA